MGATVTVACKLPNGLHLENVVNGQVVRHTLNGSRLRTTPEGREIHSHELAGSQVPDAGFGLTPGVPADFWEQWAKENAEYPPFKKGMIFANADAASVKAVAKEMTGVRTGFEGLNPDKPGLGVEPVAA